MRYQDLAGKTFGFLTALEYVEPGKHGKWLCRCICGKDILVITDNLTRDHTRSCGCKKGEMITKSKTKHGKSFSKVHNTWKRMKYRCCNPSNPRFNLYGARGITVCDRWMESFENFIEDMGEPPTTSHSLDRIDNNGNYEPLNCRWATQSQQCNNQERCKKYTYENETHTLKEWAELKNVSYDKLRQRINRLNWSFEKAINN